MKAQACVESMHLVVRKEQLIKRRRLEAIRMIIASISTKWVVPSLSCLIVMIRYSRRRRWQKNRSWNKPQNGVSALDKRGKIQWVTWCQTFYSSCLMMERQGNQEKQWETQMCPFAHLRTDSPGNLLKPRVLRVSSVLGEQEQSEQSKLTAPQHL